MFDSSITDIVEPDDEDHVWRYMDLARFVSLLSTRSLHFARNDLMADKWEGAVGDANHRMRPIVYGEDYEKFNSPEVKAAIARIRREIYLNCWHASERESAAMWEIYQRDGRGVAVRSTWGRLKLALLDPRPVHGGVVKYVDYSETFIPEDNVLTPFFMKRLSFEHEREVRLLLWTAEDVVEPPSPIARDLANLHPDGQTVAVDLDILIDNVFVAPDSPQWVVDVVEELVKKFDGGFEVSQSSLSGGPLE